MRRRKILAVALAAIVVAPISGGVNSGALAQSSPVALTGLVRSQEEGAMEGVLVSAKRGGSTITTTVVSDASGRYSFPRNRLEPGAYSIRIRAVGYEVDGAGAVNVTMDQTAELDLSLRKTQDLAAQLSNGEWLMSLPGSDDLKSGLLNCTTCHGLQLITRSRYTAGEFVDLISRMGRYAQGSTPTRPHLRPNTHGGGVTNLIRDDVSAMGREGDRPLPQSRVARTAEYLATVNLSSASRWEYPLKTLPRPEGKATRDAIADRVGYAWGGGMNTDRVVRLNTRTGEMTEYLLPSSTNIRRVNVDNSTNPPTFWVGNNLGASIIKVEPLN